MAQTVRLLAGEKLKGETKKAILACNDYLRMGPGRSLRKLEAVYRELARTSAPTQSIGTLNSWSARYDWQARAETYDAHVEAEKNARRQEILQSGLALEYERVAKLKTLADMLEEQIYYEPQPPDPPDPPDPDTELTDAAFMLQLRRERGDPTARLPNVWLPDVKQIGGGEFAERVDIVRFNAALISEFRAALDDLAKETGGRRQRTITENIDYSKLSDEQLARIAAGEDVLEVILSDFSSR